MAYPHSPSGERPDSQGCGASPSEGSGGQGHPAQRLSGLRRRAARRRAPGELAPGPAGPGRGIAPRPGRAAGARLLLEGTADVRESLDAAEHLIDRIRDEQRQAAFRAAYRQAKVPLIQAPQAGHRFVFDQLEKRLATARERAGELLAGLVNPAP